MATFCPFFFFLTFVLWTWELCVDLAIYFWKSYLLNILYEKRIKVVFVLEREWRVCLWCIKPNMSEHMKGFSWGWRGNWSWRDIRLQRALYPNMFTANYIVARYPCVKSILETKIPTLLMILGQRFPCCSALSSNLSSKPYKLAALRSSCCGVDFKTTSSAESVWQDRNQGERLAAPQTYQDFKNIRSMSTNLPYCLGLEQNWFPVVTWVTTTNNDKPSL